MPLLECPVEIIRHILRLAREGSADPHRSLAGAILACRRLNVLARDLAYEKVVLVPKEPTQEELWQDPRIALTEHATLLDIQPDIGRCIQHLAYVGLTTDPGPFVSRCSVALEEATIAFCRRTPALKTLELSKCFFEDTDDSPAPAGITGVEHLYLRHATVAGTYPYPVAFAKHFPDLKKITISTALCICDEPGLAETIGKEKLPATHVTVEPSYPLPTATAVGLIHSTADTLIVFTLYLPLVAAPPDFALPDDIHLSEAVALEDLKVVFPLFMFPRLLDVRDTFHYAATTITSATPELKTLTFAFDAGSRLTNHVINRFDAIPVDLISDVLDNLGENLQVFFELRVGAAAPLPTWAPIYQRYPEWLDMSKRDNVYMTAVHMPTEASPFHLAGQATPHHALSARAFIAWYRGTADALL